MEPKDVYEKSRNLLHEGRARLETYEKAGQEVPADVMAQVNAQIEDALALKAQADEMVSLKGKMDELDKFHRTPVNDLPYATGEVGDADKGAKPGSTKAYQAFLRKGVDQLSPVEHKTLAMDSDTSGGVFMPVNKSSQIIELLTVISPIRELASVETIGQGDSFEVPKEGSTAFTSGWVSERGSRTATTTGTFAMEKVPVHEGYAAPRISQKTLDDAAFDIEGWINRKLTERFAVDEGTAFVSGTGVGQPQGLLTISGVTAVNSGSATLIKADGMINLFYGLPDAYARNATWLMRRATVGAVAILKDGVGNYLWRPGLEAGTPNTILNAPYRECPDMPAVAASVYPVIFGDIKRAYLVVDRQDMVVLRDPYSAKPLVEFYTTRRVGGQPVLTEAYQKLYISA
mgnify:CR=1 FL=1